MKITKKDIETLLSKIAKLQGEAISENEAKEKGLEDYYKLILNGGYKIHKIGVGTGIQYGSFNEPSYMEPRTGKEMYSFLNGILYGLNYQK